MNDFPIIKFTVAFITGIYERLIEAIRKITPKNYFQLFMSFFLKNKKTKKSLLKELDIFFLTTLFAGIFTAIILGSKVISYLIENYYAYVFAFFTGLILASALFIGKEINTINHTNRVFGLLGFLLGIVLLFVSPKEVLAPSSLYVLLGGFIAIFALFLPGISGSFLLLILGLYEYIINIIKELPNKFLELIPFIIGAILGVVVISRTIHFLFKWDKPKTLYVLLGLVLGTLLIPIRNIVENLNEINIFTVSSILIWFLLGYFIVQIVEK